MNSVIENVQSQLHREKVTQFYLPVTLNASKSVEGIGPNASQGYAFTIKSEFIQTGCCASVSELKTIEEQFVRALRDALYGDMRSLLRQMHSALYERDFDKMQMLLRDFNVVIDGH